MNGAEGMKDEKGRRRDVVEAARRVHDLLAQSQRAEWAIHAWRSPLGYVSVSQNDSERPLFDALNDLTIALGAYDTSEKRRAQEQVS